MKQSFFVPSMEADADADVRARILGDKRAAFSFGPVLRNDRLCDCAHRIQLPLPNDADESACALGVADQESYDRDATGEPEFFDDNIVMTPVGKL